MAYHIPKRLTSSITITTLAPSHSHKGTYTRLKCHNIATKVPNLATKASSHKGYPATKAFYPATKALNHKGNTTQSQGLSS